MANLAFATTLLGALLLTALLPTGTAAAGGPELFLVPPGTTQTIDDLRAERVVVRGTLVVEGALHATAIRVLDGGVLRGPDAADAAATAAAEAKGTDGADAKALLLRARSLQVTPEGAILGGRGGNGGDALGQGMAAGGDGGRGGDVLLRVRSADLQGTVLGGAGGAGGDAVVHAAPDAAASAQGGAGGDSGRVLLNGRALPPYANAVPADAGGMPSAAPVTDRLAKVECGNLPAQVPCEDGIDLSPLQQCLAALMHKSADLGGRCADASAQVQAAVAQAEALVDGCAGARLGLKLNPAAACQQARQLVDEGREQADEAIRTCGATMARQPLPWSTCKGLLAIAVEDALVLASPALPGLPGLVEADCSKPVGDKGKDNVAGNGGNGGDACVVVRGSDGSEADDGASGVIGCSAGGPGGPGGNAGAAVANGGNGGNGAKNGGAGGSATAGSYGGNGGNGGNGGTRWGSPDCPGGAGGAGGNAADATATGGTGGNGLCGGGGMGGLSKADSKPGHGGAGGAGDPPGTIGLPGTAGVASALPGQGGTGLDVCMAA